jgi:hypothetical protein
MSIIRKEQLTTPLSASYAETASFALNANANINTGSLVTTSSFNTFTASINNFTSSVNTFTASYNTGSFTGSFTGSLLGTSSWAINSVSSSFASTASYLLNAPTFDTGGLVTTSSFNTFTASVNSFTSSYNTGSFSGSFIGDLQGTSSWATNAQTASFLPLGTYQITSSWAQNALTASYIANLPIVDTSSLVTTSSFNAYTASINGFTSSVNTFTASYNTGSFSGSFTGSLFGTASFATTASYALNATTIDTSAFVTTSSFNAFTSSINTFTASYSTGSFSGSFTGSLLGTSSWAINSITASYIDPTFISASAAAAGFGPSSYVSIKNINDGAAVTGTTSIIQSLSVLIPANTFTVGDVFRYTMRVRKTGAAGVTTVRGYVNTADNLAGALQLSIASSTSAGHLFAQHKREALIKSVTVTETLVSTGNSPTDDVSISNFGNTNVNWAVNQWLILAISNASAADSTIGVGIIISKI